MYSISTDNANNILFDLYLFHFNLRNDESILEQTVIQIRFLSIRHINQFLLFQLQHCMTMRVDDLIMKIENMRIFSTKSSFSDKSCYCLWSLRELHLFRASSESFPFANFESYTTRVYLSFHLYYMIQRRYIHIRLTLIKKLDASHQYFVIEAVRSNNRNALKM